LKRRKKKRGGRRKKEGLPIWQERESFFMLKEVGGEPSPAKPGEDLGDEGYQGGEPEPQKKIRNQKGLFR